jgi:putative peptide zinc metalloprotease protein
MMHLEPDEFALLDLMDGTHRADDLATITGVSRDEIEEFVGELWEESYLVGSPQPHERRTAVTVHGVEFAGFARVVDAIDSAVGTFVFSVPAAVLMGAVALGGLALFFTQVAAGDRLTVSAGAPVLAVVVLRTLGLAAVGPHETGHALVLAHNGRRVGRAGVGFYWGAITFYVDASQALFLPRRTRMLQSSAGILTDFVTCGVAAGVAVLGGDATWAVIVREFAVLGYLNIVLNAVPLLELDGYWFLADWLDRPTLAADARQAVASALRRHPASQGLVAYGLTSVIFGVGLIVLGFGTWWALFGGLFRALWGGGIFYKVLALYLVLPFIPIVVHIVVQPVRYLRRRTSRRSTS